MQAGKSIYDAVSPRHQHYQQRRKTSPVPAAHRMDGQTSGRRSVHLFFAPCRNISWYFGEAGGKKRRELEEWFKGPEGPQALFRGRVLAFDEQAALIWARLMSQGTQAGRPRKAFDMVVAAIGKANDCVIVSDNEKHFPGVNLLNPLRPVR